MIAPQVLGRLDPTFAWDGARLYRDADLGPDAEPPLELRGAAGSTQRADGDRWRIVRDPLGLNKLFWARAGDAVSVSARPWQLIRQGHPLEAVRAIPRGVVIDGTADGVARHSIPLGGGAPTGDGIEAVADAIRSSVDGFLAVIASAHPGAPAFVCLSGGLDSSSIAVLAREHFPRLTAVSFDLLRDRGRPSDDRLVARRLAGDLGLPLLEATVTPEQLLAHLDTALVEGVDWRDFNVHAALVNAALAETIGGDAKNGRGTALVFTGDLANEFLADYHPEHYGGATYYGLPELARPALRRMLVRGLDTSHREIGVFAAFGLSAVQPYAAAVDAYLALPDAFIMDPHCKAALCRELLGARLPAYVYARPKVRAQVGGVDAGRGVLGLCVDRGLDTARFKRRFAELHGVDDPGALDRFIRAGVYRSGVPATTEMADGRA